jgi:hypothetical protein
MEFELNPRYATCRLQQILHIIEYMKQFLIEIDDDLAARLEKAAPGRSRRRSDFVRHAIRQALWELEEQATAEAYRQVPDSDDAVLDSSVWEPPAKRRTARRSK